LLVFILSHPYRKTFEQSAQFTAICAMCKIKLVPFDTQASGLQSLTIACSRHAGNFAINPAVG